MADPENQAPAPQEPAPVVVTSDNPAPTSPFSQTTEAAAPFAVVDNGKDTTDETPHSVIWTASEFIAHDKSATWYIWLAGCAAIFAAFIYLATRDAVSTVVVLVAALLFGLYGARKPKQVAYQVDGAGFTIGTRRYSFQDFRSFAIHPEGAFSSIEFMPLKRFSPAVSLYYAPEDEEKIIALLSDQLPFDHRLPDAVERLMRRIRF
jgi:hypothetical protein